MLRLSPGRPKNEPKNLEVASTIRGVSGTTAQTGRGGTLQQFHLLQIDNVVNHLPIGPSI